MDAEGRGGHRARAGGDRRHGLRWPRCRAPAAAGGHRRHRRVRAGRRCRRNVARQPLPGCCLRRAVSAVRVLVRTEPRVEPAVRFAGQQEIWAYLRDCADRFDVRRHMRFGHDVCDASWDDAAACWRVTTSRGVWTADVLIAAAGVSAAVARGARSGAGGQDHRSVPAPRLADWRLAERRRSTSS